MDQGQFTLKLSSHMCDTTRQQATRHDRGPRHDDFLVWCHTYHDTTMRLDSDSLQTPVNYHKRTVLLLMKIRVATRPVFFAHHTIKWICSHICSTTKSGRHDKKLLQQKSLMLPAHFHDVTYDHIWSKVLQELT